MSALLALFTLATTLDPTIAFQRYQLPNGLTVILSEDHRLPQVAVNITYHVGAADQPSGRSGLAHLFEHVMFAGAKHIGPQVLQVLERIGTAGGQQANGTASWDRTGYFEVVPSAELPTALWIESDRMAFLLDVLDEKKLKLQRDVVSNERRQRYENRAYGIADLRICERLFPKPHPYSGCVIGSIDDIQGASIEDVSAFFRRYYAPNNASLAIVGNFEPQQAKALVARYFGPIPRQPAVARPQFDQPPLPGVVRETLVDKVATVPQLDLDWVGVKRFSAEEPAAEVLARILAAGKASRLYQELVVRRRVASDVGGMSYSFALGGFFRLQAQPLSGHRNSELEPIIDEVLADVRKHGVTRDEVERTKALIVVDKLRALERAGGFGGGRADLLNDYQTFLDDPGFLEKDLARYRAVTPESVQAFANAHLGIERRLVLDIQPAQATTGEPR